MERVMTRLFMYRHLKSCMYIINIFLIVINISNEIRELIFNKDSKRINV